MDPFATEQEALAYATRNGLRPTEFVATSRGSRVNVVATQDVETKDGSGEKRLLHAQGRPYTLKVKLPVPVESSVNPQPGTLTPLDVTLGRRGTGNLPRGPMAAAMADVDFSDLVGDEAEC